MAKFWEVIKAFQEGSADKAERGTSRKIKAVREGFGVGFYDDDDKPFDSQGVGNDDLTAEWEIIVKPEHVKYDFLQMVVEVYDGDRMTRRQYTITNESLHYAERYASNDFGNKRIEVRAAVGISKKGVITILVQEGERVNG